MKSLVFLLIRSMKNSLLEVLRKPAKLALWIFFIAFIVGLFLISVFTGQDKDSFLDIIWLKGILFLLIMIFVAIAVQKGLSNGDVIFDMNDVNLLFVSPVNPRLILMYGIVRMAKMSFFGVFLSCFWGNSLGANLGRFGALLMVVMVLIRAVASSDRFSADIQPDKRANGARKC
jgi:hypothetical protein